MDKLFIPKDVRLPKEIIQWLEDGQQVTAKIGEATAFDSRSGRPTQAFSREMDALRKQREEKRILDSLAGTPMNPIRGSRKSNPMGL